MGAARAGHRSTVEVLLAEGADPGGVNESTVGGRFFFLVNSGFLFFFGGGGVFFL